MKLANYLVAASMLGLAACSGEKKDTLPDPPASVAHVKETIKGRTYQVVNTGFYGPLTVNGKPEAEWIDTTKEEKMVKDLVREIMDWKLKITNDTAATVTVDGKSYPATYEVTDAITEGEAPGIRLKISYLDPSFSFGADPSPVTYTYLVKGISENQLLLELPRQLNRRELLGLLEGE